MPLDRGVPNFAGRVIQSLGHPIPWGHSSAGRALQWHCRGHRFDPGWLHQVKQGLSQSWLSPFGCSATMWLPHEIAEQRSFFGGNRSQFSSRQLPHSTHLRSHGHRLAKVGVGVRIPSPAPNCPRKYQSCNSGPSGPLSLTLASSSPDCKHSVSSRKEGVGYQSAFSAA